MKPGKIINALVSLFMSGILALGLFVVLDCIAVFFQFRMVPAAFLCLLGMLFCGIHFCKAFTVKRKGKMILGLTISVLAVCALSWAVWYPFQKNAAYVDGDEGKAALYGNRDVMVIVPHQDDEANILGGVLEELRDYGSCVRVVFATNGDYDGIPDIRLQEAIAYCETSGIPEENVIFLGYGDRWDIDAGVHLYNAPSDMVLPSRYGASATYGLENHPAYRQDHAYTRDNFLQDLQSVILEHTPEWIFCIDYDDHIEHKALSLAFEKVMGTILKENPQYRPIVLKGYAYGTAWFAQEDFYGLQIRSTEDIFREPYLQNPVAYHWEDRIRFPVDGSTLSRSLVNSGAFRSLELYSSQNAQFRAQGIVNGDRVFWQRRTDSLCLNAVVEVSSGNGALLNDFMHADNVDLREQAAPLDGIWIPEGEDTLKTVTVSFSEKTDVSSVVLCDHPSEENNILNAEIVFEDGAIFETGPLYPSGAPTEIPVNRKSVSSFRVIVTETEGEKAGLGEIEAYAQSNQGEFRILKLTDVSGNFVYDHCISEGTSAEFRVYTCGDLPAWKEEHYTVSCDNVNIRVSLNANGVAVECPKGQSGSVHLVCNATGEADTIFVRNPGKLWQIHVKLGQRIEKFAVFQFRDTIVSRVGRRVLGLLNG